MKNIAVYGSLRKGLGNHRLLTKSELLSTETVNIPFKMVSLGGFPGLIPSEKNHDIIIEIYSVDEMTYQRIEWLESFPSFYQKAVIPTSLGDTEIYVLESKRYQGLPEVENGDWFKFITKRYEELSSANQD